MPSRDPIDLSLLDHAQFPLVRRGFEPAAVRALLRRVAAEIADLRRQGDELNERLLEAEKEISDQGPDGGRLDAHRVASALGSEAMQVLEAAHVAATERTERAEREAAAIEEAATSAANTIRTEAVSAADAIRAEGSALRDEVIAEAQETAAGLVESGRVRGREMVSEAQVLRERILLDLGRKRQSGRTQVEQLRAGRDRLLESLAVVQKSVEAAVADLLASVPEARRAAERAGLRTGESPEPTLAELEAEVEEARLIGHLLIEDDGAPEPDAERELPGDADILSIGTGAQASEPQSPELASSEADPDAAPYPNDAVDPEPRDLGVEPSVTDSDRSGVSRDPIDAKSESVDSKPEPSEASPPDSVPVGAITEPATSKSEPSGPDQATGSDPGDIIFAKLRNAAADSPPDQGTPLVLDSEPPTATRTAIDRASRALKRVLVDEQSTLLDGIRRNGATAVTNLIESTNRSHSYNAALTSVLSELMSSVNAPRSVDLSVATGHFKELALAPVDRRLRDLIESGAETDELASAVRSIYRESRTKRVGEAVSAAVVAAQGLAVIAIVNGPVVWRTDRSGGCGDDCTNNSSTAPVKAGAAFPSGHIHPPAEPSCNCWLEPA